MLACRVYAFASGLAKERAENSYSYTGMRKNAVGGTTHHHARDYRADIRGWLQTDQYMDPWRDLQLSLDPTTRDRHAYAGSNPIRYVDTNGHLMTTPGGSGCSSRACRSIIINAAARVAQAQLAAQAPVVGPKKRGWVSFQAAMDETIDGTPPGDVSKGWYRVGKAYSFLGMMYVGGAGSSGSAAATSTRGAARIGAGTTESAGQRVVAIGGGAERVAGIANKNGWGYYQGAPAFSFVESRLGPGIASRYGLAHNRLWLTGQPTCGQRDRLHRNGEPFNGTELADGTCADSTYWTSLKFVDTVD